MKQFFAALATLALTACAASSVDDLKGNAARRYEFDVPRNYQEAYRSIAQTARICWSGGFLFSPQAQRIIDADLYPDLKKGEVTIWMSNLSARIYAHALVQPTADMSSHVTVWTYLSSWNDMGPRIERWANGNEACN